MIEAVGHEHLVSYFATINAALKPGGKAVIQVRLQAAVLPDVQAVNQGTGHGRAALGVLPRAV